MGSTSYQDHQEGPTQPQEPLLLGEPRRGQPRREGGGGVARQAGPAGVRLEEGAAGRVHSGPQLSLLGCLRPEGFRSQYLCESELFRLPTYLPGAWAA